MSGNRKNETPNLRKLNSLVTTLENHKYRSYFKNTDCLEYRNEGNLRKDTIKDMMIPPKA